MRYLSYYMVLLAVQYLGGAGLRWPWILGAALVAWLLHRYLPDPIVWIRHARRVRRLETEIAHNRENATARRDLALIWLQRRRPRRALPLVREARRRDPDSAELAFLEGKALLEAGEAEAALGPLVEAARKNERLFYGEPYLVAGRALHALGRFDEAEDAFERYLAIHRSSVEGRVRLAQVLRERRDGDAARRATREALATWSTQPGYAKRAEWRWYVRARLMSVGLA